MLNLRSNTALASAAAMFALSTLSFAAPASAADHSQQVAAAKVMCFGVNSCKGQSDCKSGNHDCKGQNSCKGQGFKSLSAKACEAKHGTTTPPQG